MFSTCTFVFSHEYSKTTITNSEYYNISVTSLYFGIFKLDEFQDCKITRNNDR